MRHTNIFHCKTLQNLLRFGFLVKTIPSGKPGRQRLLRLGQRGAGLPDGIVLTKNPNLSKSLTPKNFLLTLYVDAEKHKNACQNLAIFFVILE
jgi:hypothetical protein